MRDRICAVLFALTAGSALLFAAAPPPVAPPPPPPRQARSRRGPRPRRVVSRLFHRRVRKRGRRGELHPGLLAAAADDFTRRRRPRRRRPAALRGGNAARAPPRSALRFPAGEIARDPGPGAVS